MGVPDLAPLLPYQCSGPLSILQAPHTITHITETSFTQSLASHTQVPREDIGEEESAASAKAKALREPSPEDLGLTSLQVN